MIMWKNAAIAVVLLSCFSVCGCKPDTVSDWAKYYASHKDEAAKDWQDCKSGKLDRTTENGQKQCKAAHLAVFYEYKPNKPVWSSTGG